MDKFLNNLKFVQRHYRLVVAFVVVVVLILSYGLLVEKLENGSPAELGVSTESGNDQISSVVLERSSPQVLRIPSIGIDAYFESPLGLNEDGSIAVPESYEDVGWYKFGPTPGELGPAVVLGHVDSKTGPAVFFSLGQLKVGDEIFIERADGTTATFVVDHFERHEQSGFPTDKVYGDIDHAGLRLITCTGVYDRSDLRYTHNLIVFAKLKE